MKNWLKQTSTIGGLISLLITGLQAYQSGGDVLTAILAVLSAALLLTKDGKLLAGLCAMAFIGQMSAACASIPLPKDAQISTATSVGCAVIEASGCYDELQVAMPALNKSTCIEVVNVALDVAEKARVIFESDKAGYKQKLKDLVSYIPPEMIDMRNWDPAMVDISKIVELKNGQCGKLAEAFGVK